MRSRLKQWEVTIAGPGMGGGQKTLRIQSISMHTAVDRALAEVWPARETPTYATIEAICLEQVPPVPARAAVAARDLWPDLKEGLQYFAAPPPDAPNGH